MGTWKRSEKCACIAGSAIMELANAGTLKEMLSRYKIKGKSIPINVALDIIE